MILLQCTLDLNITIESGGGMVKGRKTRQGGAKLCKILMACVIIQHIDYYRNKWLQCKHCITSMCPNIIDFFCFMFNIRNIHF